MEDPAVTISFPDSNPLYVRALVLGLFGGVSLVLTHTYSRRGPIMYPVYAAILFASTLMMAQYSEFSFGTRFAGVLLSLVVATACSLAQVLYGASKRRHARAQAGKPPLPGGAPWWGMPIVVGSLVAASAGAAALVR